MSSTRGRIVLPLRLTSVEEAERGMNLGRERSQARQEEEQLNLTMLHVDHPLSLEPEVLKCLGRTPVQVGSLPVVAAANGKIAVGEPRGRAMAHG